ncbi:hypothetical protein M5689_012286 [Euphorbia peplus]|nr:hypothetical protein M5689_012286 [Euphorbia peplus]
MKKFHHFSKSVDAAVCFTSIHTGSGHTAPSYILSFPDTPVSPSRFNNTQRNHAGGMANRFTSFGIRNLKIYQIGFVDEVEWSGFVDSAAGGGVWEIEADIFSLTVSTTAPTPRKRPNNIHRAVDVGRRLGGALLQSQVLKFELCHEGGS